MFKDWRAGLMHAGIFWGFVLLTIGTANIVTGGVIETVLSWPLDGAIWAAISAMQNVVAVIVLVSIAWAFWRRLVIEQRLGGIDAIGDGIFVGEGHSFLPHQKVFHAGRIQLAVLSQLHDVHTGGAPKYIHGFDTRGHHPHPPLMKPCPSQCLSAGRCP